MAKHRATKNNTARNAAVILATGAGIAALSPAAAEAAPVTIPSSGGVTVDVPDHILNEAKPYIAQAEKASRDFGVAHQGALPKAPKAQGAHKAPAKKFSSVGQRIADVAMSKVGSPYAWGATGPNAFDCSGLTSWAYKQVGKSIPRTSDAQAGSGQQVPLNALRPGDIVSYYGGASHVGIYVGNGKVVQALNSSSPVRVDDLHYMPVHNAVRF